MVDNSGIRIYHTPKLRPNDAGTLVIGQSVDPFQIIPPGREWVSTAHCDADCTNQVSCGANRLVVVQTG